MRTDTLLIPVIEGEIATDVMPTIELDAVPPRTEPMLRVGEKCGWCSIPLSRLHGDPVGLDGRWYHSVYCYRAAVLDRIEVRAGTL